LYSGDLISRKEAEKREQQYSKTPLLAVTYFVLHIRVNICGR